MIRIAIVEDDRRERELLRTYIERACKEYKAIMGGGWYII